MSNKRGRLLSAPAHPRWPYALNREHWMARDMVLCAVYNNGIFIDLTGNVGTSTPVIAGGDLSRGVMPGEPWLAALYTGDPTADRHSWSSVQGTNPVALAARRRVSVLAWAHAIEEDSSFPRIIDKSTSGFAVNGWGLWGNNNESLIFGVDNDANGMESGANLIEFGKTNLYGVSITDLPVAGNTDATARFFRRGVFHSTITADMPSIPSATAGLSIGNWNHSTDRMWDGYISHVFVLRTALSDQQQMAFYDPATRFEFLEEYGRRAYFIGGTAPGGTVNVIGAAEIDTAAVVTPIAGAVSVSVTGVNEVNTATTSTPIAGAVTVIAANASETNTAGTVLPATAGVVAVGGVAETNIAGIVTPVPAAVSVAVNNATELDTAANVLFTLGGVSIAVTGVVETDSAGIVIPIPGAVSLLVNSANELNTAGIATPTLDDSPQSVVVTGSVELDSANIITPVPGAISVSVNTASETTSAGVVTPTLSGAPQSVIVVGANEVNSATTITPLSEITIPVGGVVETNLANLATPVPGAVAVAVGSAVEIVSAGTVNAVLGGTVVSVGSAISTELANIVNPVPGTAAVSVITAGETNTANLVNAIVPLTVSVSAALSIESANPVIGSVYDASVRLSSVDFSLAKRSITFSLSA